MKTTLHPLATLLILLLVLSPTRAMAQANNVKQAATVEVREKEDLGPYLTDAEGMSLYLFMSDSTQGSTCYDACAQAWPPYTTEEPPNAGEEAVNADMLGTLTRKDGTTQVTYNGWPLYYYVKDTEPGDTRGQDVEGFGAEWYLISPEGRPVEAEHHGGDSY